jgi:hypothetical protein
LDGRRPSRNARKHLMIILNRRKSLSLDSISFLISHFLLFYPTVKMLPRFVSILEIALMD